MLPITSFSHTLARRSHLSNLPINIFLAVLLLVAIATSQAQPNDSLLDPLDSGSRFRPGYNLGFGAVTTQTPVVSFFWQPHFAWLAGLELRSWAINAEHTQDYLPEVTFQIRALWLSSEEREPLRGSEYFELGVGLYPAYALSDSEDIFGQVTGITADPKQKGWQPIVRAAVGRYWMPFTNLPWGIDAHLVLGRYIQGRPPGYYHVDLLGLSLVIFRNIRW